MARSETRSGSEKSSEKGVLSRLIGVVTGEGHGDARSEANREITATDLLKEDHAKVRKLFKEYQNAPDGSRAAKKRLIDQVSRELEVHARIEEEIFYPACKALRDPEARRIVGESIEEHLIVKRLIKELAGLAGGDEAFESKATVLREAVEHHADEEESDLFPPAEKELDDDVLVRLGRKMSALKTRLAGAGRQQSRGSRSAAQSRDRQESGKVRGGATSRPAAARRSSSATAARRSRSRH